MAVLRELFRDTHQLVNDMLVDRKYDPSAAASVEVNELHSLLEALPARWDLLDSRTLQERLAAIERIPEDLPSALQPQPGATATGERRPPDEQPPAFLNRPDRAWERLLWRASEGSPDWRLWSKKEAASLRDFAATAAAREQELSREGIVLAVECQTPSGDLRDWEWHYLLSCRGVR